jgi:hypothetical protein
MMMDNQPCKFFLSVGGCKYGNNCLYSHQNDNKITVNANQQPCIRPPLPLHQQVKESDNSTLNSKLPATWNFKSNGWNHSINDDEIFSYGPRGSYSTGFAEERKNFAEVLRANLPQSGDMPSSQPPSRSKLAPCRFYLGGYCKFGDHCKYDHASIHEELLPLCDEEFQSIECGICIEASSSSLFGVLSNCDCKFCLPCIREWRKEGVNVSHDTEQVR